MTLPDFANPYRLGVFLEVVRQLSFTKAARRLSLTQPAVSRHVHELEKAMGTRLFDNRKRNISLTEAGVALRDYGIKLLDLSEDLNSTICGITAGTSGRAAFGATNYFETLLTDLFVDFKVKRPNVMLTAHYGPASYLLELVVRDRVGLAFINHDPKDARLDATRIAEWETPLAVFVKPGHPLAEAEEVELDDLQNYPFIQYPAQLPGSLDSYLEKQLGGKLNYAMEFDSPQAIIRAVEQGAGITVLGRTSFPDHGRLVRVPLSVPPYKTLLVAASNKYRKLSNLEGALLDYIMGACRSTTNAGLSRVK